MLIELHKIRKIMLHGSKEVTSEITREQKDLKPEHVPKFLKS